MKILQDNIFLLLLLFLNDNVKSLPANLSVAWKLHGNKSCLDEYEWVLTPTTTPIIYIQWSP